MKNDSTDNRADRAIEGRDGTVIGARTPEMAR